MKQTTCAALLMAVALAGCTDRARDRVSSLVERVQSALGSEYTKEPAPAPATPDLLTRLISWDAIGMNLAYVQQRAGPAIRSEDHRHHYMVQGCQLVLRSDGQDRAIRSVQVALSPGCDVDIGGLLGMSRLQPLNALNFGAFDEATGSGQYLADCLRDCGNAYVPNVYLIAQGSRALQFRQVMLTTELATDPAIEAVGQWADAMVAKESEDWVVRDLGFNCQPQKYRDVAAQALRSLKPEFFSFGDELELPKCPAAEGASNRGPKAGASAVPTGMVVVPQPSGQCDMDCDMDYDKRLRAAGLKANEVSIHGPEDEDFKGYGCAYRITPAPGNTVLPGSTVTYRSAWEAG
ncbi:PASTA domain-containing protein [Comamonas odontotermitis]|uniref:PASTA domain-containing protein n=1 Tax=Comamonas odontotermitis TaxID=379895 RepID=UPI001CC5AA48|nr:PASTA domain-containing protein [Comamonas odontotermitis]UBB15749.1 PASTA domain-containing protein [Comamonas odontotermitis]